MSQKHSFPNLDIAKLIMAFLVVEIHTRPLNDIGSGVVRQLISGIDCVAVPFFFIASGFLCFRGLALREFEDGRSPASARVRGTIRKQLRLYAIWTALLLPLALLGAYLRECGTAETALQIVRGVLFVGENDFTWPLWYLLASVVAFALVYFLLRRGVVPRLVLILSAMALLLGQFVEVALRWEGAPAPIALLAGLYGAVFVTARNGLFEGFFYVAVGMCIGLEWGKRPLPSFGATIACLAFGLVGCVVVSPSAHLPFCAMFAIALFLLSIRRAGDSPHPWARKASTVVYLVHMVFAVVFVYGICGYGEIAFSNAPVSHVTLYAFTLACSLLTATIVISFGRRLPVVKTVFGV